jgi:hypothetical protein
MRTLLNILIKELLQLKRDPKILPILFVAPVIQLTLLGYAATTDIKRVELAVCDLDRTAASRLLVDSFTSSTYFRVTASVDSQEQLNPLLQSGRARVALTIPAGFEAERAAGRPGRVQLVADGADAMSGTIGLAYASTVLQDASAAAGTVPLVNLRPTVLYNPDLVSKNYMVPGILGLIIMIMTMMLTAMAIVRESELGTMEQLLVTPLTPGQLIVGKLIPYALVAGRGVHGAPGSAVLVQGAPQGVARDPAAADPPLHALHTRAWAFHLDPGPDPAAGDDAFRVRVHPSADAAVGVRVPDPEHARVLPGAHHSVPLRYYLVILRGFSRESASRCCGRRRLPWSCSA